MVMLGVVLESGCTVCGSSDAILVTSVLLLFVLQLVPRQVRAIKAHNVMEDPNTLSFKTGDLVYVIDRYHNARLYGGGGGG